MWGVKIRNIVGNKGKKIREEVLTSCSWAVRASAILKPPQRRSGRAHQPLAHLLTPETETDAPPTSNHFTTHFVFTSAVQYIKTYTYLLFITYYIGRAWFETEIKKKDYQRILSQTVHFYVSFRFNEQKIKRSI